MVGPLWGGGAGPVADPSGNLYVETGNGVFDGANNYGDSVVKLSPTGAVADYFTPFDQSTMQANDIDMGSAGAMILPPSSDCDESSSAGRDGQGLYSLPARSDQYGQVPFGWQSRRTRGSPCASTQYHAA